MSSTWGWGSGSTWSAPTPAPGWRGAPDGHRFDIVFVDAPYKLADLVAEQLDTHLPGVLAAERTRGGRVRRRRPGIASLERLRQRRYGAADVSIYGRAG